MFCSVPKVIKEKASNKSIMEINEAAMAWSKTWTVKNGRLKTYDGKFPLQPAWLDRPEEMLAARKRQELIVQCTMKSMKEKGILDYSITVLIWAEDYYGSAEAHGNFEYNINVKPKYPIQVISGDHTAESFRRLIEDEPEVLNSKTVNCTVIICPKTEENQRMANTYGNLCNYIKNTAQASNIVEICMQIHDKYISIDEFDYDDATKKRMRKDIKESYIASSAYKGTTMGSCASLATKRGRVWDLMQKIFTGNVETPQGSRTKFKAPNSLTHFIHT